MNMTIAKSIGAIFAGFATVFILSVGTDYILEAVGVFPPPSDEGLYITWMLVLALIYRSVYTVAGGYVTAWLAPTNAMRHVTVLAVIGVIGGVVGVFAGWNMGPHWYPIALAVTAFPLVWFGGKLRIRRASKPDIL